MTLTPLDQVLLVALGAIVMHLVIAGATYFAVRRLPGDSGDRVKAEHLLALLAEVDACFAKKDPYYTPHARMTVRLIRDLYEDDEIVLEVVRENFPEVELFIRAEMNFLRAGVPDVR